MKLQWSISAIKDYEGCPKRYYATRIAKTHRPIETEQLTWGRRVHEHLERRVTENVPLPDSLAHIESVIAALLDGASHVEAELPVALDEHGAACDWSSAWLRGIIDLAVFDNDGRALILDYKTGKRRRDFDQLRCYSAILCAVGIKKVIAVYVWLQDKTFDAIEVTADEAQTIIAEIFERMRRAEHDLKEEKIIAKPSALCAYCPLVYECEEGREWRERARYIRRSNGEA